MTIHATFVDRRLHLGDTESLGCFRSRRSADTYGPAMTIAEMRNSVGDRLLLARRLALLSTARHLRNQRRCKEASACEAELREVTLHLLSVGEK